MSSFKRKKFACDFDFSDVVTCGVAVALYGQTCIYIYMHIIYTIFVCIYAFVLLAENIYSAVLNLYTGCFAVYAKRIKSQKGIGAWGNPTVAQLLPEPTSLGLANNHQM